MTSNNYLVTWMYSVSGGQDIVHHQTGKSSRQATQDLYWRCVFCLFESSHRNNNGAFQHILYVNKMPPETIDGISTTELINAFNIRILFINERSLPPKGYHKAWSTQFILIDILRQLKDLVLPNDRVVVLDSDIIFTKPVPDDFFSDIDKHQALLYTIDYPAERKINGVSTNDLRDIAKLLSTNETNLLRYEGGEIACFKGEILSQLQEELALGYEWSLKRHAQELPKFNTEEHLFSYVYWKLGLQPYTANKYIKRMWTDLSSAVNLEPGDEQRLLWHLPAEKKHGFIRCFRLMGGNGFSLRGREHQLAAIFRVKPSVRDRFMMMARIPLKKTYKLLKAI